jgi:SPP1 family predicted phage head-tail adaptor
MMDIGRTNKRITFYRNEEKDNALLQKEQVLTAVKTVWASVEPTRGRPELTYKITMRYFGDVTPDMVIKFKDRYFEIVSIINVRENNEMLEIVCTEKVEKKEAVTNG